MSTIQDMQVKAGETVNRTKLISTDNQTVQLGNVSKNDTTGQNYKVDWTFDFSECSQEEILDLAGRSAVIAYRKHFRGVSEENIPEYAQLVIDVKEDVIASERAKKSPVDKVKTLLKGMTPEQLAQVLKDAGIES